MSDERKTEEERERERLENQKTLEERLKAAEERAEKIESTNKRLLEQSQDWKSKAQKASETEAERLKEIEAEKEKELVAKGEYKKLLEQQKEENARLLKEKNASDEKAKATQDTLTEARKLSAFENRLGGKLKNDKYLGFVNTKDIVIDPETGDIDVSSVDTTVKSFLGEHKDLVSFGGGKMPNFDGGAGHTISKKQWDAMPLKDKKANLSKMIENDSKTRKKR